LNPFFAIFSHFKTDLASPRISGWNCFNDMSEQPEGTLSVDNGLRRGSVTWTVKIQCPGENLVLASEKFQLGGFEWRISLAREDPLQQKTLCVSLISCNSPRISSRVTFKAFVNDMDYPVKTPQRHLKACPFYWLAKHQISIEDLTTSRYPIDSCL